MKRSSSSLLTLALLVLAGCSSNPDGTDADASLITSDTDGADVGLADVPETDTDLDDADPGDTDTPDDADPGDTDTPDDADPGDTDTPDDADPGDTDTPDDTSDDGGPSDGTIAIYLEGDLSERTYADGLVGQTPQDYQIALSAYQLRSSRDAEPIACFDHGDTPVVAHLDGDTLMGECVTSTIPSGLYSHGRVRVEWVTYTVDAMIHSPAGSQSEPVTAFWAYSDTTYEGTSYRSGDGWTEVELPVVGLRRTPFHRPVTSPHPLIDGELVDGEYWVTFPYGRLLPVEQDNLGSHWARFHWEIFEGYRWQDDDGTGHADGVWDIDVSMAGATLEEVHTYGVTGYHVTTSID